MKAYVPSLVFVIVRVGLRRASFLFDGPGSVEAAIRQEILVLKWFQYKCRDGKTAESEQLGETLFEKAVILNFSRKQLEQNPSLQNPSRPRHLALD